MLIELTLPLYRTIPVPFMMIKRLLQPQHLFILNDDMTEYIPIEKDEYEHATANRYKEIIFNPVQNAHFTNDESCEMSILLNPTKKAIERACDTHNIPAANYFVAIETNNLYYIHNATNCPTFGRTVLLFWV